MRLAAAVIGLIFPLCATDGPEGFPSPSRIEFAHIDRGPSRNTAFAGPAGFDPAPDIVTRAYRAPPGAVYAAIRAVALDQPRTYPLINYDDVRQAQYVVRSALWNFPDLVALQVLPMSPISEQPANGQPANTASEGSNIVLWSRSIYGRSDLGVNAARLQGWIAALDARLAADGP